MYELNVERLETHEALIKVDFPEKDVQDAMRKMARQVARQINIPGFRKGRAPYAMVVRYVGEDALRQEAVEQLIEDEYPNIIDKAGIEPHGPGDLEEMEMEPLSLTIRVPLEPEVTLGEYENFRKEWVDVEVSDEEIDGVLEQIREENAQLEPVERPAQLEDEIHVDIFGTVDDEVIVDEDDFPVQLSGEQPFISQDFVDELVGLSAGDEHTFTITMPETVQQEDLQGVEATFDVEVREVMERHLPELDDALASTVGSFESFDELYEDITRRIRDTKAYNNREAYRSALVEMLTDVSEVRYPPQMVEERLDQMIEEMKYRVRREQGMALEDALRLEGRTLEDFREELRPQATQRVKTSLVLGEYAAQEEIEVTEEDMQQMGQIGPAQIRMLAAAETDEQRYNIMQSITAQVLTEKVLESLEALGRGVAHIQTPYAVGDAATTEEPEADTAEDEDVVEALVEAEAAEELEPVESVEPPEAVEDNPASDEAASEDTEAENAAQGLDADVPEEIADDVTEDLEELGRVAHIDTPYAVGDAATTEEPEADTAEDEDVVEALVEAEAAEELEAPADVEPPEAVEDQMADSETSDEEK